MDLIAKVKIGMVTSPYSLTRRISYAHQMSLFQLRGTLGL